LALRDYDFAGAAVFAFLLSLDGLGRLLPNVPRKILPLLDRLSPLPIGSLPKKHTARFL
jgi:hypothetical protein